MWLLPGVIDVQKRKVIFVLLTVIIALMFLSFLIFIYICRINTISYFKNRPDSQPNTTWTSESGEIVLSIDENGTGKISFKVNEKVRELYFASSRGYEAEVYSWDVVESGVETLDRRYEVWRYKKTKQDSFVIIVEDTTFFKAGEIITFNNSRTQRQADN